MNDRVQFPAKLKCLFEPHRYKILHGGRGSGKSWGIARALLIMGASKKLRILCAREVQKSISQSVHKLLSDQIQALGLEGEYEVQEQKIKGRLGTEFYFTGLLEHTVDSIKSFEGCDICWVEEAQNVSKHSWQILAPTIRKDESEIWISFNPQLDTDETYVRFVENKPADGIVVEMNWRDNPWFNDVMEKERQRDQKMLPAEDYLNIWEGKARSAVEGAIYADEVAKMFQEDRVTDLPHDRKLRTHVVLDLGWNDSMFAVMVQRHISSLRIIDTLEVDHVTYPQLSAQLRAKPYNWGTMFLPHDGAHGNAFTGKSARQTMRELGWTTSIVPNLTVEAGIRQARMDLERVYIDRVKGAPLVECLKRYRRHVNSKTDEAGTPVHDRYSHGADAWRYTALVADKMTNDTDEAVIPQSSLAIYEVGAMGL